jgi:hypothetical protein
MYNLSADWDVVINDNDNYYHYFPNLLDTSGYNGSGSDGIDPVQCAADFYILFGLHNNTIVEFPSIVLVPPDQIIDAAIILKVSFEELRQRNKKYHEHYNNLPSVKLTEYSLVARDMLKHLIEFNEETFIEYAVAAVGGELRHHKNVECLGKGSSHESRYDAWSRWGYIYNNIGASVLEDAVQLFLDFPAGSYGGKPWANAAQLVFDRLNHNLASNSFDNSCFFLDRIFNMQHNTGSFLNKLDWACLRYEEANEDIHRMHDTVLKAHGLNPPDLDTLYLRASPQVQHLLNEVIVFARSNDIIVNAKYTER